MSISSIVVRGSSVKMIFFFFLLTLFRDEDVDSVSQLTSGAEARDAVSTSSTWLFFLGLQDRAASVMEAE